MDILIKNCSVLPMDGESKYDGKAYFVGAVGIRGDKIELVTDKQSEIEEFERSSKGIKIIDGRGKLVMPGLINTHGHVSMTLLRGYADDLPLMTWLNEHVWPFEAKLTGEDIMLGAQHGIAEMLLGGTTTFVDMYWQEAQVAKAVDMSGIRGVLSPTFTDAQFEKEFKIDLKELNKAYGNHPRIEIMVAPHSAYTCSKENLVEAKRIADQMGIWLQIHISETLDEQAMMRERVGKTPIEYLDSLGVLDGRTLAAHCVHVNESDIETMSLRGISVAYNPHSNTKLASGIAPIQAMMDRGINVSVGTDGASSNNDLDMWEEMRTGSFLQKVATMNPQVLPAYTTLEMATVNGAKAVGMGGKLGQIKRGMLADLVIMDLEQPHLYPQHDLVANLVYCGKASDVDTVIVDGEIVVENRNLTKLDALEIAHRLQRRVQQIG